jgi:hypothetical protein
MVNDYQRTISHTGYLEPEKSVSYLLEKGTPA